MPHQWLPPQGLSGPQWRRVGRIRTKGPGLGTGWSLKFRVGRWASDLCLLAFPNPSLHSVGTNLEAKGWSTIFPLPGWRVLVARRHSRLLGTRCWWLSSYSPVRQLGTFALGCRARCICIVCYVFQGGWGTTLEARWILSKPEMQGGWEGSTSHVAVTVTLIIMAFMFHSLLQHRESVPLLCWPMLLRHPVQSKPILYTGIHHSLHLTAVV